MKNILIVALFALALAACDKPIRLDLGQSTPRVIIEGQVTNRLGSQYVKVSRSSDFYQTGPSPRITNAIVTVKDSDGNEIMFEHNPRNYADSIGYYLPQTAFVGTIGKDYHLRVEVDGQVYEADDHLYSVTSIDSLAFRVDDDEKDDPKDYNKFYEVLLYAKEPQNTTDYYLFKFYRNDSLKVDDDNEIYYSNDEALGESIDGISSPVFFGPGDKATVEAYSLSRSGYVFYDDLQKLLNTDGGLFNQPPANSRTNLTNGAFGFFHASAVNSKTIVIVE
ncbi:DUF4249 domain-containing protein [Chryseolinea lacunae]|uniref:DUF4249 domain-containing protein n=1 Tax=Chryseolinea lacunae TaxID=2801331 RepID=A0ABS1KZX2_9BACT|nr:DUF4249 domain-containing protein [Chryseolinea lacunae]MBL0744818.1 DUF4249 domain-containing protein [Chryseolinea lacunae]